MTSAIRVAHVATVDMTHRFLLMRQLTRLRDEGYDVTAISAPGPYAGELEAAGIRHVPWPSATRAWDPAADVRAFRELLRLLRQGRYEIVHTHNPKPGIMGRLAARIARVPIVVNTVHGFYATPDDALAKRAVVLGLERIAGTVSDLELFQSEEDLMWARRRHIVPSGRTALLGNGTDLRRFDPAAVSPEALAELRRELGIDPDAVVVGTVCRLVAEKGIRELFEAARRVRRRRPEVRFLFVGGSDGDKSDAIGDAEMAEVSGEAIFTGFRTDMPELFALMDVFVLPSWREGVPRSAIEAAAMGTAMVLTDIRGCREVAANGEAGLLVPVRDPEALTAAIERLLGDEDLRTALGTKARRRALECFDERRVEQTVVDAYARLLAEHGLRGRRLDREGLRSVRIRPARVEDVGDIARLHALAVPTAFLPMLGQGFLRRLFRALVEDPGSVAVVAESGGKVVGYAGGMTSLSTFRRRFLMRHGPAAAVAAAPSLVRPGLVRRALETGRYSGRVDGLPDAEFAFLGVRRGTAPGLGMELTKEVLLGLAALGATEIKGFVACENRAMNHMVRRFGFEQRREIVIHEGRRSNVWVIGREATQALEARAGL